MVWQSWHGFASCIHASATLPNPKRASQARSPRLSHVWPGHSRFGGPSQGLGAWPGDSSFGTLSQSPQTDLEPDQVTHFGGACQAFWSNAPRLVQATYAREPIAGPPGWFKVYPSQDLWADSLEHYFRPAYPSFQDSSELHPECPRTNLVHNIARHFPLSVHPSLDARDLSGNPIQLFIRHLADWSVSSDREQAPKIWSNN